MDCQLITPKVAFQQPAESGKESYDLLTLRVQVDPEPSGKLAGKTFTIPLQEADESQFKSHRSPSPSKDSSDKKGKKHKKTQEA